MIAELASVWITHHSPLGAAATCRSWANVSAGTFAVPVGSWRVDETYARVAGNWAYLYRAVDSAGETIDFMLSPKRDLVAAKHFLQLALGRTHDAPPRVINVDGHPANATATAELKQSGQLAKRCRCRPSPYMNNVVEQDHRFIKKRIAAGLWFRSVRGALNTIPRYEAMHVSRTPHSPHR